MFFTGLLIFYYVFGILLYDCLPMIQWIDEVTPWALFLYALILRKWRIPRSFVIFLGVALFYLLYSFIIHSNVPKAILFDFAVQMKPFVTFFSVVMIAPKFCSNEKKVVRYILTIGAVVLMVIGVTRIGEEVVTVQGQILSGAKYSITSLYTGLTYIIFAEGKRIRYVFSVLVILLGLCAPTSKFLLACAVLFVLILFSLPSLKRYRIVALLLSALLFCSSIYFILDDFKLYFTSEDAARLVLFVTAALIIFDYFPFGSGFASFATSASANYYSNIYSKYGIDTIYGLSESDVANGNCFVSDVGVASMAEFGLVGLLLFCFWFIKIIKISNKHLPTGLVLVTLFILLDIILESSAATFLTGNTGVYIMFILGVIYSSKTISNGCLYEKSYSLP